MHRPSNAAGPFATGCYTLYEALFGRLLSRCQQRAPGHRFRFRHKLYAVDASTIDLCLAVFPWASFRRTKAAIKLHIGLDQAGHCRVSSASPTARPPT